MDIFTYALTRKSGGGDTYETVAEIAVGTMEAAYDGYAYVEENVTPPTIDTSKTYYLNDTDNPSTIVEEVEGAFMIGLNVTDFDDLTPSDPSKPIFVVSWGDGSCMVFSDTNAIENTTIKILKKVSGGGTELPSFPELSIGDDGKTLFIRRNLTNFKNELVWEKPYPDYQRMADETKVLTVKNDETTGRNVLDWEYPQDGHPREVYHASSRDKTSEIQRHVIYPADDDSWDHLHTEVLVGNFCIIHEHPSNRVWFVIERVRVQVGSKKENGIFCVTFTQNGGVLGRTYLEDTQQTYGEEEYEGQPWPVGTLFGTETVLIPEHTVSDAGKYLKVDANGSLEWGT